METDTWQPCKCLCGTAARYNIKCIHQLTGKGCYKNVFSLRLLPPPKIGIMQTRATVQLETRGITKKQGTLEKEGAWRQAPDLEGAEVGPRGTQLPLSHTIPFHGHFIPWHLWMSLNLSLFTYDQGSNVVTALVMESSFSRKKEKKSGRKKSWAPGKKAEEGEMLHPLSTVLTWVLNWEVLTWAQLTDNMGASPQRTGTNKCPLEFYFLILRIKTAPAVHGQ